MSHQVAQLESTVGNQRRIINTLVEPLRQIKTFSTAALEQYLRNEALFEACCPEHLAPPRLFRRISPTEAGCDGINLLLLVSRPTRRTCADRSTVSNRAHLSHRPQRLQRPKRRPNPNPNHLFTL